MPRLGGRLGRPRRVHLLGHGLQDGGVDVGALRLEPVLVRHVVDLNETMKHVENSLELKLELLSSFSGVKGVAYLHGASVEVGVGVHAFDGHARAVEDALLLAHRAVAGLRAATPKRKSVRLCYVHVRCAPENQEVARSVTLVV